MNLLVYFPMFPSANAAFGFIYLQFSFLLPVLATCIFKWLLVLPSRESVLPGISKGVIMLDIFLINTFSVFVFVLGAFALQLFVVIIVLLFLSVFLEAKYYSIVWHMEYKECLKEIAIPINVIPIIGLLIFYWSFIRSI